MVAYTETVLPELAYLVAQHGDPALLNAAAGFSSYFEREEVQRLGCDVQAARRSAQDAAETETSDPVSVAALWIANSSTAFAVKSSAIPEVTAMYFAGDEGTAEVTLVSGRTVTATHPPEASVGSLLNRHLRDSPDMLLVVRHSQDSSQLHLALSGDVSAYSDDGSTWREGDASQTAAEVLWEFTKGAGAPRPHTSSGASADQDLSMENAPDD